MKGNDRTFSFIDDFIMVVNGEVKMLISKGGMEVGEVVIIADNDTPFGFFVVNGSFMFKVGVGSFVTDMPVFLFIEDHILITGGTHHKKALSCWNC